MNTQVDALSSSKEPDEWMLAPIVTRRICSTYGIPTVDLFASESSKQVPRYFTTDRRDPHALGTDALHQSWDFKNQLLYVFHPPPPQSDFAGAGTDLQYQLLDDSGDSMVAEGTLAPELIRLSVRLPFRLPERADTILNLTYNRTLSDYNKLHMMVWLISAQSSELEGLNLKWLVLFKTPGNHPQESNTLLSGDSEQRGVAESSLILMVSVFGTQTVMAYYWGSPRCCGNPITTLYALETISENRRVRRFMRATFLSRPPPRKLKPIWDVVTVLTCIENWGDIDTLSRTRLTHQMVMLLAIAST